MYEHRDVISANRQPEDHRYPNVEPAADSLFNKGYKVLGWDVEWHFDARGLVQDPCSMIEAIDSLMAGNKTRTPGHLVLLAHDQAFSGRQDSRVFTPALFQS